MTRIRYKATACVVVAALALPMVVFARGSAAEHAKDFLEVINGYNDPRLVGFYKKFSSDIDSNRNSATATSVSARIKRSLAERYGVDVSSIRFHHKHRYIAHQWVYGGSISREDLRLVEQYYPKCRADVINAWVKFSKESNDYIISEFALQRSPWIAKGYCAILYYTHIIGDWLPEVNKDFDYLMPLDDVIEELVKAVRSMGRSDEHQKYCNELMTKLKTAKALGGTSPQQQAVKVLRALKEMKLGTMIHTRFGKYLDESRHPYREESNKQEFKKAA